MLHKISQGEMPLSVAWWLMPDWSEYSESANVQGFYHATLVFTVQKQNKTNPLSSGSAGENTLLMREDRREWPPTKHVCPQN